MLTELSPREKTARKLCHELSHLGLYWNEHLGEARGLTLNPEELWEALVAERMALERILARWQRTIEALELIVNWLNSPDPKLPPKTEQKIEQLLEEAKREAVQ